MAEYELAIRARRVVTPDGIRPATVAVRDGRIAALAAFGDAPDAARVEELPGQETLLPGLVDTHVHVNEPGRTEWEGFASATRAAAEGGVTTLIDMPLNCLPPTTTTSALRRKRPAADGRWVDVGFWGGAVPGNVGELAGLHRAGVFGFKAFLVDSGVPEFGHLGPGDLDAALAETARLDARSSCTPRMPPSSRRRPTRAAGPMRVSGRRPPTAEDTAIARHRRGWAPPRGYTSCIRVGERPAGHRGGPGGRVRAGRDPSSLPDVLRREILTGRPSKCCPPIRGPRTGTACGRARGRADRRGGIRPFAPPAQPEAAGLGDFAARVGGSPHRPPAVWTQARQRGHSPPTCTVDGHRLHYPWRARQGGDRLAMTPTRGVRRRGEFTVDPARLRHRHPVTPTRSGVYRDRAPHLAAWPAPRRHRPGGCWPGRLTGQTVDRGPMAASGP
jgi:allantoinase